MCRGVSGLVIILLSYDEHFSSINRSAPPPGGILGYVPFPPEIADALPLLGHRRLPTRRRVAQDRRACRLLLLHIGNNTYRYRYETYNNVDQRDRHHIIPSRQLSCRSATRMMSTVAKRARRSLITGRHTIILTFLTADLGVISSERCESSSLDVSPPRGPAGKTWSPHGRHRVRCHHDRRGDAPITSRRVGLFFIIPCFLKPTRRYV